MFPVLYSPNEPEHFLGFFPFPFSMVFIGSGSFDTDSDSGSGQFCIRIRIQGNATDSTDPEHSRESLIAITVVITRATVILNQKTASAGGKF